VTALQQKRATVGKEATVTLICPETKRPLYEVDGGCAAYDEAGNIARLWKETNGFLDLIYGDRFDDATDEACRCYEVESNTYSSKHYWIPLFKKMFPDSDKKKYKILAIGCGIGVEVDLLCEAGFACFGIDNGNRAVEWNKRKHPEGLIMANGMALPFENGAFDAVFCGCVFAHVGVIGDSNQVSPTGEAERQKLAKEMVRVCRPDGHVVACSPNRYFPFDIFHGRAAGSYKPKFNPPWSHFLLSVSDFRKMFQVAGAKRFETLPVEGFWGFVTMRNSFKGRLLSAPIRLAFRLASEFSFLRSSPIVPWIAVKGQT